MKALGGCFFIDDFGRQLVSPADLLNRWIVPHGEPRRLSEIAHRRQLRIPFEELVIFATNLEPEDLMDAAFLRRLPYKIEVGPPNLDQYRPIFETECERHNMTLRDEVFDFIVYMVREEKGLELAGFHPQRSSWTRWRRRAGSWERTPNSGHPISITRSTICGSDRKHKPRSGSGSARRIGTNSDRQDQPPESGVFDES